MFRGKRNCWEVQSYWNWSTMNILSTNKDFKILIILMTHPSSLSALIHGPVIKGNHELEMEGPTSMKQEGN